MDFDVITNSLKKGFDVWKDNLVAYIVAMILIAIIGAVLFGIASVGGAFGLVAAAAAGSYAGMGLSFAAMGVALLLCLLIVGPLAYGLYFMAIKGTRGEKVKIGDVFYAFKSVSTYIRVLIFFIVYGLLMALFSIIPIIGSIIFMILFIYTAYIYIMTPSEGIIYALKESFNVAKDNIVMTIVAVLVYYVLIFIGSLLFGIGLLVTAPIAWIFVAYVLKELKPGIKDES